MDWIYWGKGESAELNGCDTIWRYKGNMSRIRLGRQKGSIMDFSIFEVPLRHLKRDINQTVGYTGLKHREEMCFRDKKF